MHLLLFVDPVFRPMDGAEVDEIVSAKFPDPEKDPKLFMHARPWLMGKVSGLIKEVQTAQQIVDEMVKVAAEQLTLTSG